MKTIPNLILNIYRKKRNIFLLRFQFQHREHCFIHNSNEHKLEREKDKGYSMQLEGREKSFTMTESFLKAIEKLEMDSYSRCIVDQYKHHIPKNKDTVNEHTPEFDRELTGSYHAGNK